MINSGPTCLQPYCTYSTCRNASFRKFKNGKKILITVSVSINAQMYIYYAQKFQIDPLKKNKCVKMTHSFSTSNGSEFIYNVCLLSVASYSANTSYDPFLL